MTETILNEYSLLMNLTIRSLESKDFGNYVCISSNPIGKAEGVVRLQGTYHKYMGNRLVLRLTISRRKSATHNLRLETETGLRKKVVQTED